MLTHFARRSFSLRKKVSVPLKVLASQSHASGRQHVQRPARGLVKCCGSGASCSSIRPQPNGVFKGK
jgi:hypothetical protein